MDLYLHDPLQEYAKSRDDLQRLNQKAKKISQLTQKLYQLAVLEETLQVKLKLSAGKQDISSTEIMKVKPPLILNSTAPFVY